ncbi:MAG: tetratricopeptide repeat protein [Acidobacteriia bacterium]|nr:tetratricopeptide repeat protein [Terriglobia bacterium]
MKAILVLLAFGISAGVSAQVASPVPGAQDTLKNHYDAALNAQSAGDLEQAVLEYRAFLSEALHRLADRRARAGDFAEASKFLEQTLPLAPDDSNLRLDYAETFRGANDLVNAQTAAETALQADPQNARANFVLGEILLRRDDNERAKDRLEAAVQYDSTFEHGYALATAYLKLKDPDHAKTIFEEMRAGFGDTAVIHMEFGRAFAEAGYPEHGIDEFKKAIAKDDKLPGAHYSLGAAYLVGLADAAYPVASEEFHKELKNHPDDVLSLYQLGYIVLSQHKLKEAEDYLGRAGTLDPTNPDMPLSLGQAYAEENRLAEAEVSLRKSIALTRDVSRNHYQVQRAHYLLGRLLLQTGRSEEAKGELKISEQLLKQSVSANQGQEAGMLNDVAQKVQMRSAEPVHAMDPEALKQVEAYEKQLSLPIADAYNNLGAIAAGRNEFLSAAEYFRHAAFWNPSTDGLDYNWGRAAFSANQYQQAIAPLSRYLQSHPKDTLIRSALGSSLFRVEKYSEAAEVLKPLEVQIGSNPRLDYIYSVSLVKSGAFSAGVVRLQVLEQATPWLADVHAALGEAYAQHGDDAMAVRELRVAIELNPADANSKQLLALTLVKLQQNKKEVPPGSPPAK